MATFDYEHPVGDRVEYVNGAYQLTAVKTRSIAGRDILYCLGEALLDNSCCGATGLAYALVIGELVGDQAPLTRLGRVVSRVNMIADTDTDAEAAIRATLLQIEPVSTVNFYTPPSARAGKV